MIKILDSMTLDNVSYALNKYFTEDTLFFDIECTGLSPKNSIVYLIGCARRKENHIELIQFFAENYDDEKELLEEFNNYLSEFKSLLGFNSTRFDQPFLLERFKKFDIDSSIHQMPHKDLYLATTKAKCILNLENYKQKTLEKFLGLYREDKYNGGELIPVYKNYVQTKDQESKNLVLLHNIDDVKGMITAINILAYTDLLDCDLTIRRKDIDSNSMLCSLESCIALPREISKTRPYGIYICKDNNINISLKTYSGELKTYLNDYKNYYYLIDEGIIVPKVIGSSVDKTKRRNATKKDCAVSQTALYVQVPTGIKFNNNIHVFKRNYDDDSIYLDSKELTDEDLIRCVKFMLKH